MAAAAWNTLFGSDRHRARWHSERIAVRSSDDEQESHPSSSSPSPPRRDNDMDAELQAHTQQPPAAVVTTASSTTTNTHTSAVPTTNVNVNAAAATTAITSSSRFSPSSPRQRRSWQTTRNSNHWSFPAVASSTTATTTTNTNTTTTTTTTNNNNNDNTASANETQPAENSHHHNDEEDDDDDEDEDHDDIDDIDIESFPRFMRPGTRRPSSLARTTTTMTLAELEDERELARRRSSACMLLAAFVLFRLWILAIEEKDFGLLLLCLVGTSWTARWIGHSREREDELDRRIAQYLEQQPSTGERRRGSNGDTMLQVDRNELRMLSFQAQLALAIMESQRQMMQGGYGHPDGDGAMESSQGVSEQAKATWQRFAYAAEPSKQPPRGGSYGSLALPMDEKELLNNNGGSGSGSSKSSGSNDEPHCSICLAEYETGDQVVQLPCHHLYHDECISSWTSNHVKCPLCNLDLEVAATATATPSSLNTTSTLTVPATTGPNSAVAPEDSMV